MKKDEKSKQALKIEIEELQRQLAELKRINVEKNLIERELNIAHDAMNSTVGAIIIANELGNIQFVNFSFLRMFRYHLKNEILNRKVWEIIANVEFHKLMKAEILIDKIQGQKKELLLKRKDETEFYGEALFSTVTDKQGNEVARMASIIDISKRKEAEAEVKILRGFLPICASCKKIRNDEGYWEQIENYIMEHSEAEFTHSLCPQCVKELYSDFGLR